ncbi:MAG: GNAT superfamily N-acetyltransferase [Myxococcota bacterium]|jgi:GNAT superfamily N-acetyltransferase
MIASLFARLVQLALDLVATLIRGILGAPATAVKHAVQPIDIRRAKADELVDVRHTVLRQGRPRETARFEGDQAPDTRHWVADRSGIVIGVVTVIRQPFPSSPELGSPPEEPPQWQLRGMATLPEYRGQGLGRALLLAAQAEVAAPLWCNAREAVVPFYTRHGWAPAGDTFEIPPIGPHVRMIWRG